MKKLALLALTVVVLAPAIAAAGPVTCTPTGYVRDGINLTAAQINPPKVTGTIDATGCNIGVYFDATVPRGVGLVTKADIYGANYFGVVANGDLGPVAVDILSSAIHDIGENPLDGTQHGVAVYYRAASGRIVGNTIADYQKGGIVANLPGTDVQIRDNVVTGQTAVNWIAQNGIQIGYGATAIVMNNTVSGNAYSGAWGASSGGIIVVGGAYYGGELTTNTQIVQNTLINNDIGIYLSNWDEAGAPLTPTNIKVVNNTVSNTLLSNISGGGSIGYQACISDVGNNDKIINNKISGKGCNPAYSTAAIYVAAIDADPSFTNKPKVHANK